MCMYQGSMFSLNAKMCIVIYYNRDQPSVRVESIRRCIFPVNIRLFKQ